MDWNNLSSPSRAYGKYCVEVVPELLSDWPMKFQARYSLPMWNRSKQQDQYYFWKWVHWSIHNVTVPEMAAVTEQQLDWHDVTILLYDNHDQPLCLFLPLLHWYQISVSAQF